MMRFLLSVAGLFFCGLLPASLEAQCVYISEYTEGSSFNKCIEIYNGTGGALDLAAGGYELQIYSNGSSTASQSMSLSGTVAAGDVYVVCHGSADPTFLAQADATNSLVINFNGDDAMALANSGGILDVFGQIGVDPGSAWPAGSCNSQNSTLRRSSSLSCPSFDGASAFDGSAEWTCHPINDATDLGSHTTGTVGVTANQFAFQGALPSTATNGTSFTITVCATDGSSTATGYTNSISLTDNGSSATYTVSPSTAASPSSGCADFIITPSSTGSLNLDFGNSDFTNITTGSISVVDVAGSLNFQMINPCGNDGQNEFLSFSTNVPVHIDDIGLSSRNGFSNNSLNYYWGNQAASTYSNPTTGAAFSSTLNNYDILDPAVPAEASIINARINELNTFATTATPTACAGSIFIPVPTTGIIPANATVVFFLGAGDATGFDDAINNLNFGGTNHCGQSYYAIFGNGSSTGGYFSNSNGRVASLILNGQVYEQDYTPGSGEAGFFFSGESYQNGGPCVPAQTFLLNNELLYFRGRRLGQQHQLYWGVETTASYAAYDLERSAEGWDFQPLLRGIAATATELEATDAAPLPGLNYYRLVLHHTDGQRSYSSVIALQQSEAAPSWQLYPNPSAGLVTLRLEEAQEGRLHYELRNPLGQLLQAGTYSAEQREQQLHFEAFPSGWYLLRLSYRGYSSTRRLFLKKP